MSNTYNIVFPGQGSQRLGMGSDFYEKYPASREVFSRASEALGEDLGVMCFTENEKLDLTENTQPCILTCSIAMFNATQQELQFKCELFAGHSLGEYTALVAAEIVGLEDAVKIVRRRGALMQKAVPAGQGAMAALIAENLASIELGDILRRNNVDTANLNSASQTVISGDKASIEKATAEIAEHFPHIEIIFLNVSAPFHSALMKPIEGEFRDYLMEFSEKFRLKYAASVLSNFTGRVHEEETLIDSLVAQISGSVRWRENMKVLAANAKPVLEIGPNKPLNKFLGSEGIPVTSVINLRSLKQLFPTEVK